MDFNYSIELKNRINYTFYIFINLVTTIDAPLKTSLNKVNIEEKLG